MTRAQTIVALLLAFAVSALPGVVSAMPLGKSQAAPTLDPNSDGGSVFAGSIVENFGNPETHYTEDWQNPCKKPEEPEPPADEDGDGEPDTEPVPPPPVRSEYYSVATGRTANDAGEIKRVNSDGDGVDTTVTDHGEGARTPGVLIDGRYSVSTTIDYEYVVELIEWETGCKYPNGGRWNAEDVNRYWVQVPTEEAVTGYLLARIFDQLGPPIQTWPSRDLENDWLYVNVPMDIRIAPLTAIDESITASNVAGTVTVSVRAEPSVVVFDSGEPGAEPEICEYEATIAPYDPEEWRYCWYTYAYSSGIEDDNVFRATTTLYWEVTANGQVVSVDPISSTTESIAVAEIQAVNTVGG